MRVLLNKTASMELGYGKMLDKLFNHGLEKRVKVLGSRRGLLGLGKFRRCSIHPGGSGPLKLNFPARLHRSVMERQPLLPP